ncbi:MAG: hypothetical protein IT328_07145 [Caldilineaceae bacterium]|nr:hypothetical protein [Caldilineaceae bacterium]
MKQHTHHDLHHSHIADTHFSKILSIRTRFTQPRFVMIPFAAIGITIFITIFITILVSLLATSLPARANAPIQTAPLWARHPDAGIWVVYRGNNTAQDLQKPYIKGVMAYTVWNDIYVGPNQYDWYTIDKELDFIINQAGKKAMLNSTVGYCPSLEWPAWMRDRVATHTEANSMGCHPLQFWDPVYIDLYKVYINNLATHLAQFDANDARPDQTDILFVRAQVMAETMENLPNDDMLSKWQWQDFTPAPNGNIHKVDLTRSIKYAYQEEITLTYQRELARAYAEVGLPAPTAAAKGGGYWGAYPTRDTFVAEGVWFDQHSGSPNPPGWYYDLYSKVKSGETRGTTETGGRAPDDLLAQYTYWEILAALHFGVEFIGIYGTNRFSPDLQPKGAVGYPENQEALAFGERYAGHYRDPATSPGAWIALRGGYPEDRFSGNIYARRMWTNYEFLMTQYRPQDSVLLVGLEHTRRQIDSINPVVRRYGMQRWTSEVSACERSFTVEMCEYLLQPPDEYLWRSNGRYEYTYPTTDLGKVVYCGETIFCGDPANDTHTETMLWARRTNGEGGSPYMRFNLNDAFAESLGGRAQVRVVYLDAGNGKWELRYDSKAAAEKSAVVVQKGNSNLWKEVTVDLQDAAFMNRQEGGTDLSLFNMGDDDDTFHLVEVLRVAPVSYEVGAIGQTTR